MTEDRHDELWLFRDRLSHAEGWSWLTSTEALQRYAYGFEVGDLAGEELADYVAMQTLAAVSELQEFLQCVKWKAWQTGRGRIRRDEAVDELVDVAHFVANLAVALDVGDAEWERRYRAKQIENVDRQLAPGGYAGRNGE